MSTKYGAAGNSIENNVLSGLAAVTQGDASAIKTIQAKCKGSGNSKKSAHTTHKKSTMASSGGNR